MAIDKQLQFNWHLEYWHHFETLTITSLMPHISNGVNKVALKYTRENETPEMSGNL